MINKALFTSNSDDWETPQELFDELDKEFNFQLDPCATVENTKCPFYYTKEDNGLEKSWKVYEINGRIWKPHFESVFMNPPYGKDIGKWIKKAYEESLKGCLVVCLLPARTDTRWFHDYCLKGEIRWIKGRLRFSGKKNSAPFPSMIVIFRGN